EYPTINCLQGITPAQQRMFMDSVLTPQNPPSSSPINIRDLWSRFWSNLRDWCSNNKCKYIGSFADNRN
ncbi:MAG: hypothetical protein HAW61_05530, partial [Candidatus Portiera sp.]|nr:hypothetical protein [Portiera sp.]